MSTTDTNKLHIQNALAGVAAAGLLPAQGMNDYVFGALSANNVDAPFQWDLSQLPESYDLLRFQERVEYQLGNSCAGQAAAEGCELFAQLRAGVRLQRSPYFAYYNPREVIALATGKPVQDVGTSVFGLMSEMTKQGICSDALWPAGRGINTKPDATAYADGLEHCVGRYERCGRDSVDWSTGVSIHRDLIADLKVAIYYGMPVVFAIPIAASFGNVTGPLESHPAQWEPTYINAPNYIGGHAMLAVGWRKLPDGEDLIIVKNSWGAGWGDGGFWGVRASTLRPIAWDCFTMRSFDGFDADIPMSMYHWSADCQLRDGRRVTVDVAGIPGQVYRLYRAAFDRAPDMSGMGYWVDTARLNGMPMEVMADFFIGSAEFQASYGTLDNLAFVQQLYRNVLHREGEAAGVSFWVGHLDSGALTRPGVLAQFAESPENVAATRATIEAGVVYT